MRWAATRLYSNFSLKIDNNVEVFHVIYLGLQRCACDRNGRRLGIPRVCAWARRHGRCRSGCPSAGSCASSWLEPPGMTRHSGRGEETGEGGGGAEEERRRRAGEGAAKARASGGREGQCGGAYCCETMRQCTNSNKQYTYGCEQMEPRSSTRRRMLTR